MNFDDPSMRMTHEQYLAHEARVRRCAKTDAETADACDDESKLHEHIRQECKSRGWITFRGSMAHRAMRTLGEPDFTVLADGGRIYFVEAKTKAGKLSREQLGLKHWAENLGHKIHVVRSLSEFLKVIE